MRQASPRGSCHEFGPWLACGCGQGIADHQDGFFADGLCAFEFRTCRHCPATEERHLADIEPPTVPELPRIQAPSPGGPSATSSRRAGSPNHPNARNHLTDDRRNQL